MDVRYIIYFQISKLESNLKKSIFKHQKIIDSYF